MSDSTTTVSLPPHLISKLEAVADILPEELKDALTIPLKEQIELSYSTLLKISQWSRTDEARKLLSKKQMDANDYIMVSLLAGTITSPLSKFPDHIPPPDPSKTSKKNMSDRKAIVALVNSLFSIAGAGYAGWWASQHTRWRDEWRALFALAVALTVALTEGILFFIWHSREEPTKKGVTLRLDNKKLKKGSEAGEIEVSPEPVKREKRGAKLRKRRVDH